MSNLPTMTDMLPIELPSGHVAIVDSTDAARVEARAWHYARTGGESYVLSRGSKPIYLHRLIMGAQPGQIVDHINGDTLDCRRANLRFVDRRGSNRNRGAHQTEGRTSPFKGVSWDKKSRKWVALICADGVIYRLGLFASEEEAAQRYDDASHALHAEHGRRNFPDRAPEPITLRKPVKRDESYGWHAAVLREP